MFKIYNLFDTHRGFCIPLCKYRTLKKALKTGHSEDPTQND